MLPFTIGAALALRLEGHPLGKVRSAAWLRDDRGSKPEFGSGSHLWRGAARTSLETGTQLAAVMGSGTWRSGLLAAPSFSSASRDAYVRDSMGLDPEAVSWACRGVEIAGREAFIPFPDRSSFRLAPPRPLERRRGQVMQ